MKDIHYLITSAGYEDDVPINVVYIQFRRDHRRRRKSTIAKDILDFIATAGDTHDILLTKDNVIYLAITLT